MLQKSSIFYIVKMKKINYSYQKKLLRMKDSQAKFIIKKECKNESSNNFISNEGRWSKEEHEKFLEGIALYGINWKKIKTLIETRTPIQVRSHAQKFYRKMKVCKDERLGIDFTSNSVLNIRDMINQIKNNNYNIINIFKYLSNKFDNREKSRENIIKRKNKNIFAFKKSELDNQFNIISLKEDSSNINYYNFFFNYNNNINKLKKTKETEKIYNNKLNEITKMNSQNNIFYILQNLLIMNYNSILFNSLLSNNLYLSNYDITNSVNKLLINYLISNNELNIPNINNEKALLSLALRNNILNNIILNFIHNKINLEDINYFNIISNNSNYNIFNNINNGNNIDLRYKNNIYYNIDNKDNKNCNSNINKIEFFFYSDKQLNKINDMKKKIMMRIQTIIIIFSFKISNLFFKIFIR